MEATFCQSCGMPMKEATDYGTNQDGSANNEYCTYCFKDGNFSGEMSMDEMIEHCLLYLEEFNKDNGVAFTKEDARAEMKKFFPTLKRWQQNQ